MSINPNRSKGLKESCFNFASNLFGCDGKQCCYACAGLSEKPLYINDEKHAYLYVAICEGHVNCLEKILEYVTKKIDNADMIELKKKDIKSKYLQKIYMSLIEIKLHEKRERMFRLLTKYGFSFEDEYSGAQESLLGCGPAGEDTYRL